MLVGHGALPLCPVPPQAGDDVGGQFNIAKQIPGKEEFQESIDYFRRMLTVTGVKVLEAA